MAREFTQPNKQHKVGIVSKTNSTQKRVVISEYDDRVICDIRDWYIKKDSDNYLPGKGITIRIEDIPRLRRILRKVEKIAVEEGYLVED